MTFTPFMSVCKPLTTNVYNEGAKKKKAKTVKKKKIK